MDTTLYALETPTTEAEAEVLAAAILGDAVEAAAPEAELAA